MKLSDHLHRKMQKNLAVVDMFHSPGWNILLEEKIEPLEFASWQTWKGIPPDDVVQMTEMQIAGKIGDRVRSWQNEYESIVERDRNILREIELKQEEDVEMDLPVEEEVGFVRRWLNKYGEWVRRAEVI